MNFEERELAKLVIGCLACGDAITICGAIKICSIESFSTHHTIRIHLPKFYNKVGNEPSPYHRDEDGKKRKDCNLWFPPLRSDLRINSLKKCYDL